MSDAMANAQAARGRAVTSGTTIGALPQEARRLPLSRCPARLRRDVDKPVNQLGGRNSGFSSERRSVHPAARANSSKNVMS
jgi:hypothetical protein